MGQALQLVAGYATNPSTTITAITMESGDSANVANFPTADVAYLLNAFSPGATKGVARIRSPRLHDQAQGIRMQRSAANYSLLLPSYSRQPLYPGDTLTLEVSGGASETDQLAFIAYYANLPGVDARLMNWADIEPHIKNIAGVEVDLAAGGTAGQYGTTRALNYSYDTLKSGVDYALLGYECSVAVGVVSLVGPDTGNMRLGGPGSGDTQETRHFFVELSERSGLPCIPVINANNRQTTLAAIADVAASTASNVSFIFAELGQ